MRRLATIRVRDHASNVIVPTDDGQPSPHAITTR
jgi:hypothetical protein